MDWNSRLHDPRSLLPGHSLLGSVDWNTKYLDEFKAISVTPFLGVWIEILDKYIKLRSKTSLPSWECGLKYLSIFVLFFSRRSLPSWECGLKFVSLENLRKDIGVTPFLGVWIEILYKTLRLWSFLVTPFLGVWIEILQIQSHVLSYNRHSLLGSVDWNASIGTLGTWTCCHSLLGSVDWNICIATSLSLMTCHSLLGSVDWNICPFSYSSLAGVTPFLGVWIEIWFWISCIFSFSSLPSWECGLKLTAGLDLICRYSHSLLGSVDWNYYWKNQKDHT